MRKGEIATVGVTSINSEGEGVARCESGDVKNFVVFLPGALPGERVRCRVVRSSKNYAAAEVLDILDSSGDRVSPRCGAYGRCGGCQLQHASYRSQVELKKKILADAMRRIGRLNLDCAVECFPSPEEWGYRSKAVLPVGRAAGYYERRSHNIVPFDGCPILKPQAERVVSDVICALAGSGFRGYDERKRVGDIRYIAARYGECGGLREVLSGVVLSRDLSGREFGRLRDIHQKLGARNPDLAGSVMNVKTGSDNFVWGPLFKSLCGKKFLNARLGNYRYRLDISSFFQINAPQAERIFSFVSGVLEKSGSSSLLELYSGVGSLTLFLASVAGEVDAVEEWRPAARRMAENMEMNGASNVRIFAESSEAFMRRPEALAPNRYDAVVLDPPRAGCSEDVINGIRLMSPETVVYVSCNPATLARDVARMAEDGMYRVESLAAYDMFPQTAHVESVCVMRSSFIG
ncbi:MAG: 23S rRNA (uracil(1939)-C(5))-methyltransferase RlmD [Synergistaceae bacterium]|jgi:23S rRNA (uracil1939-C5)-methyltransferase|nr:23S rRNA (uracil(1939)-C(5))-methyltransferase RlmD [Synergistaceae bacterium]